MKTAMLYNFILYFLKLIYLKRDLYSCIWLSSACCFFGQKVSYCSIGNSSKYKALPIIYKYFNGDFDIDKFAHEIRKSRINILTHGLFPIKYNIINNCKGCCNFKKDNLDDIDFSFYPKLKTIQFSDYALCNSKCIYCNSWKSTKYENDKYIHVNGEIDSYEIMPIIKELTKKGMIQYDTVVEFAGGEPTMYRQFEEALNYLINFGLREIIVFSNIINYSEAIENGIRNGRVILTVSIDAGSKEIHEKVKGVKSYSNVYHNLEKYSKIKKEYNQIISKYVIIPNINDTQDEILLWIIKSSNIDIQYLELNVDDRTLKNELNIELAYKIKELSEFFIEKAKENNMKYTICSNIHAFYNLIRET